LRRATESETLRVAGQLEAGLTILRDKPNCACVETRKNADGELHEVPACRSKLDHALRVAREAAGFLKSGPGGRSSDVPNPTLAALIGRSGVLKDHRGPEWWQDRMGRDVALVSGAFADLIVLVAELGTVTSTDPRALTKTGQGTCPACDHFCSGAVNDRLVSGLCDTDYRAWCRAGRPERFQWINQRRAENGKCKHPSVRWSQGVERCTLCNEPVAA
jgi:hypothetical protein